MHKSRINFYFRAKNPNNYSIENLFNSLINAHTFKFNCRKHFTKNQFDIGFLFRRNPEGIHHITGAVNYLALTLPRKKTILTVHDIGYYENPLNEGLKKVIYKWFWFKLPLKHVAFITVVSEFTKNKLIEKFDVHESKIIVIPNPVLPHFKTVLKQHSKSAFKILQIGTGAHKNLLNLIKAVVGLDVELLIIGNPSQSERESLLNKNISHKIYTGLTDEKVFELYVESDLLFFASFYEGFGMPIIEAQKVGRPVITSNFGAMKEVANGTAILVDPENYKEIRSCIYRGRFNDFINIPNGLFAYF